MTRRKVRATAVIHGRRLPVDLRICPPRRRADGRFVWLCDGCHEEFVWTAAASWWGTIEEPHVVACSPACMSACDPREDA